jgi:hypothetical protein
MSKPYVRSKGFGCDRVNGRNSQIASYFVECPTSDCGSGCVTPVCPKGSADWLMLWGVRVAQGVSTCDSHGVLLIEDVKLLDREARRRQQLDDWPGELASARDPFLNRVEASLPAAYPLVRGQPVFEKMQRPQVRGLKVDESVGTPGSVAPSRRRHETDGHPSRVPVAEHL